MTRWLNEITRLVGETLKLKPATAILLLGIVGFILFIEKRKANPDNHFSRNPNWAKPSDLKNLKLPREYGIFLGFHNKKSVYAEKRQSVLVIGPSQSGKTTNIVCPNILRWKGPLIITSTKSDVLDITYQKRLTRGKVHVFDPANVTKYPRSYWSPVLECSNFVSAKKIANYLCMNAAITSSAGINDAQFWYKSAAKLLSSLLLAAHRINADFDLILGWLNSANFSDPAEILENDRDQVALESMWGVVMRDDKQLASIVATLDTLLEPMAVLKYKDGLEKLQLKTVILDQTLYICAPSKDQRQFQPLYSCLLSCLIDEIYARSFNSAQPKDQVLAILDEAAHIAPIENLDEVLATCAGHNLSILSIWQDMSQIEARYSQRAWTIFNNHRAKLALPGICDWLTLDKFSFLLGDVHSFSKKQMNSNRVEHANSVKRLAPHNKIRLLKQKKAILIYGNLSPAILTLGSIENHRH
jgi:type IV secretion system protein VirD4